MKKITLTLVILFSSLISLTAQVDCSPISTLDCGEVETALPLNLDFTANNGKISNSGFTMVLEPSARLAADDPVSNTDVPGYEPGLIVQSSSGLTLTSTKGIFFSQPSGTPSSTDTNSQINALGAGFVAPTGIFNITLVLNNPNFSESAGNSSQQSGLWFGLDEDHIIKLVVAKTGAENERVQLQVEDLNTGSPNPLAELNSANNIGATDGQEITLRLELNPGSNTVTGYYTVDGGSEIQVGATTLSVPTTFFSGTSYDSSNPSSLLSFAGIFTTQRRAAASQTFDTTFTSFEITEQASNLSPEITTAAAISFAEGNTLVIDVEATDDNDSEGSGLTYSFSGGLDIALFDIDASTGAISFLNAPDFDSPQDNGGDNIYNVQITVTDSGGLTAVQDITITVTEVTLNTPPVIVDQNFDVAEDAVTGTLVGTVSAADDGALIYDITAGNDDAVFDIDTDTGEIVTLTNLDFETTPQYILTVAVDDGEFTETAEVTINVTDVDDSQAFEAQINFQNAPNFTTPPAGYLADYGKAFGNAENMINYDGADYTFGWKLESNGTPFDVSPAAGNGGTGASGGVGRNRLDNAYNAATDTEKLLGTLVHFQGDNIGGWAGQPRGNELIWELQIPNGTYDVTLGLGDISNSVDSRHSATVEGYTVIPAFDPSVGQKTKTGTITVEVQDNLLTINGLGGFNSKITHIIVSESTNTGVTGELAFVPITSSVSLEEGTTSTFTNELTGNGATDISTIIDDNETISNDWLTLPNSNTLGNFEFAADATSLVSGDTRSNTIIATAAGYKPAILEADLTVTEAPVVEITAPFRMNVAGSDYTLGSDLFVAEETAYLVGTSQTSDNPYTVVGGNDGLYVPRRFGADFGYAFPIADGNYQVTLHMVENFQTAPDQRIFDVSMEDVLVIDDIDLFVTAGEKTPYLETFDVTVADGELNIDFLASVDGCIIMAIEILPAPTNQNPTITSTASVSIAEGETTVINVESTDDLDAEGSGLVYSLSGGLDIALFDIDATVGTISFLTAPDFETPQDDGGDNIYNLQVTVTDSGNLTAVQDLVITVTDIAENTPPVIVDQDFSIAEDVATGTLVGTVSATDDTALEYDITAGNDDGVFDIDSGTGEITTLALLDFETTAQYILTVSVDDGEFIETASITINVTDVDETVPCNPISTLDCEEVVVELPLNLDFSSGVSNTILESNGLGTGFTAVQEHSEARRNGDLPISNTDINGYEPSLLNLNTTDGHLEILSQAGIAFRKPGGSTNNNNQVNTLGVGLENVTQNLTIKTTIVNIVTGGQSAQAGIWFGYDEDNFVKLNVNNNNIELRVEENGFSTNDDPDDPDNIPEGGQVQEALGASGNDVVLEMIINPTTLQAEAYYTIADGTRTLLGSLDIPQSYFSGRDINASGAQDNVTFAGIFATHRNGNQFTASFDDFSITEEVVQPVLAFDVNELNFTVEENGTVAGQTVELTATPENANLLIDYSLESAQSWVLTPTSTTVGQVTFNIDASGLAPGEYTEMVNVQDDPDLGYQNTEITINLTVTEVSDDFAVNINFSDPATEAPIDYIKDSGDAYGDRGNGFNYGWLETDGLTGLNLTANTRFRNIASVGVLEKTLIHMQYGDTGGSNGVSTEGIWEIEVPNGTYNVTIGAGDPSVDGAGTTPIHKINVEGVTIIDEFGPTGVAGSPTRWTGASGVVNVSDGRMTFDANGGFNTKINYVQIIATDGTPLTPRVLAVNPVDNATGVSVNTSVSANDLFLPNGDSQGVFGVNNATITPSTVQLFKLGEQNQITATVNGTGGGDAINLDPIQPLESNTTYIFRIDGVEDTSGVAFELFESTFTTGSGNTVGTTDLDNVAFDNEGVVGSPGKYSTLTIGPDNKFYALRIDGDIYRWDMAADGTLINEEVLSTWKSNYASRAAIGLAFDPTSTSNNLIAYISHQSGGLSNAPEWDGKISRISGANLQTEEVLITDLPRSIRDHLTNSIAFRPGESNALYFNQGSNSAGGAPDGAWGNRPERLLSAATLKLDLSKLPVTLP